MAQLTQLMKVIHDSQEQHSTQLYLDQIPLFQQSFKHLQPLQSLTNLSLCICKIHSLHNFPELLNLTHLFIADNKFFYFYRIQNLNPLSCLIKLSCLDASNNKIKQIDSISQLSKLQLYQFTLHANPISQIIHYRPQIFKLCTSLEILDGKDIDGVSVGSQEQQQQSEEWSQLQEFISESSEKEIQEAKVQKKLKK